MNAAGRPTQTIVVIVPVYNEESVLSEFLARLDSVIQTIEPRVTVICVDDGSVDRTGEILAQECARRPYLRVLELSRNFGQSAALRAGLDEADGDAVIFMDADLQDPPELLVDMIKRWQDGAEVVVAQRRSRGETGLRRGCLWLFHALYSRITDGRTPPDSGIYGLIGRPAFDALKKCPETHLYLPGLRGWVGFRQEAILFDRPSREGGASKQSIGRLVAYAWDAITSFSVVPLRVILFAGVVLSMASFGYALVLIAIRVAQMFGCFAELRVLGFTTLAVAVFFLGGIQMIGIGVLGEYLARVYDESKRRPAYIVKRRFP